MRFINNNFHYFTQIKNVDMQNNTTTIVGNKDKHFLNSNNTFVIHCECVSITPDTGRNPS